MTPKGMLMTNVIFFTCILKYRTGTVISSVAEPEPQGAASFGRTMVFIKVKNLK
jgi:hypothetical protein